MNTTGRAELPAYALAALLVIAIAALAGVGATVPDVLPYALTAVVGAGAGVSLHSLAVTGTAAAVTATSPAPVTATAEPLAAPVPAPSTVEAN